MARIFTGDYSTGNLSQWATVENKFAVMAGNSYPNGTAATYALQPTSEDKDCGYCARFETRTNDFPPGYATDRERNEVGTGSSLAAIGTTRWYAFSIKFDSTFPANHHTLGWCNVCQFPAGPTALTSPAVSFGYAPVGVAGMRANYWYLFQISTTPKSGGGWNTSGDPLPIAELALDVGQWQDIKMQVKWTQDATGFINLWRNGQRQTFTSYGGSGQTFTGQTAASNGGSPGEEFSTVYFKQGIYRQQGIEPTAIIYHAGFRMADDEAGL